MKHELKNALVTLNIDYKVDENTQLVGNINSLVQVLNNLISNAIQSIYNNRYNEGYNAGRTNPIIQHVDISANPSANSYSMNWNLSNRISKYASLVLYQNLFPFMVSALDMSNWNTSMRRSCILYNWGYNATNGILTIRSAYTDGGMVQYGSAVYFHELFRDIPAHSGTASSCHQNQIFVSLHCLEVSNIPKITKIKSIYEFFF